VPATGAKLEVRGITVWRIVDGRIREEWTEFDMLRVVRHVAEQLKWKIFGFCAVGNPSLDGLQDRSKIWHGLSTAKR